MSDNECDSVNDYRVNSQSVLLASHKEWLINIIYVYIPLAISSWNLQNTLSNISRDPLTDFDDVSNIFGRKTNNNNNDNINDDNDEDVNMFDQDTTRPSDGFISKLIKQEKLKASQTGTETAILLL